MNMLCSQTRQITREMNDGTSLIFLACVLSHTQFINTIYKAVMVRCLLAYIARFFLAVTDLERGQPKVYVLMPVLVSPSQ